MYKCNYVNFPRDPQVQDDACLKFHPNLVDQVLLDLHLFDCFAYKLVNYYCLFSSAEHSMVIRSIIVINGSILICIEDLSQFGGPLNDSSRPYFSLDVCCSIDSIQEVVS